MDWPRVGRAFVEMERDSLKLVRGSWPNFDQRYYEQAEQVYLRWLSEMREAGIASPTGLLLCLVWLYGLAWARVPAPWRWPGVLVTLLWAAGAVRAGTGTSGRSA